MKFYVIGCILAWMFAGPVVAFSSGRKFTKLSRVEQLSTIAIAGPIFWILGAIIFVNAFVKHLGGQDERKS